MVYLTPASDLKFSGTLSFYKTVLLYAVSPAACYGLITISLVIVYILSVQKTDLLTKYG